ncbi:MAG: tetratricopeptide repeat protein [Nitrospira sp.]
MWSWIIITCTMLLLMNACGNSRPIPTPTAQDKPTQVAKQVAGPSSSIQRLRMQAERGNVEAQFALAQAYDRGRDVPKDKTEAVRWYRLAATQGDPFAQNALGDNYWEGTGVPKDDAQATRWWHLAATQGFAPAQHSLGKILSGGGQGVRTDKTQAYMWLALSAAQGDEEASRQGNLLSKQLKPAEVTNAKKLVQQWKPARARVTINRIAQ